MRSFPLIQQYKNGCPESSFAAWGEQSKVSHRVPTAIGNILHQNLDKFLVSIPLPNKLLISSVLASNRRVDITLSSTGQASQESVRQYPFNAADSLTLLKEEQTKKTTGPVAKRKAKSKAQQ